MKQKKEAVNLTINEKEALAAHQYPVKHDSYLKELDPFLQDWLCKHLLLGTLPF
ncbi:hypothetical protein ACQCT6_03290 [Cytobacillus gottheilii]